MKKSLERWLQSKGSPACSFVGRPAESVRCPLSSGVVVTFGTTNVSPQDQRRGTIRRPRNVDIVAVVAVSSHIVIERSPGSLCPGEVAAECQGAERNGEAAVTRRGGCELLGKQ